MATLVESGSALDSGQKVRAEMADVASEGVVVHDLGHYLRPLRRHAPLVVGCVVAGLVLGVIAAVLSRATYTAATRVQPQPNPLDQAVNSASGRTNTTINPDTEAQIIKSSAVGALAQQLLKTTTPVGALVKRVTVTVPANTPVLRIACTAHSGQAAKDCSAAFAQAYLNNRAAVEQASIKAGAASFSAQIRATKLDLRSLIAQAAKVGPGTPRHIALVNNESTDNSQITTLSNELNTLTTTVVDPGSVISASTVTSQGTSSREILVLAGLALGLLAGVGLVFLRERLDRCVRHADDLRRAGVALIAEIPAVNRRGLRRRAAETTREYDAARTRADQRTATAVATMLGDDGGSLYIAAVTPGQGEHGMAERLATELGRFGSSVAIVRPALPTPQPAGRVQPANPGIIDTMSSRVSPAAPPSTFVGWPGATPADAGPRQPADADPVGTVPSDPARGAAGPAEAASTSARGPSYPTGGEEYDVLGAMRQVEDALRRARYVIIEGEQAALGSEAYIFASLSQVSVLVVEPGRTSRADLSEAVEQVRVTSSELVGAVVWRPGPDALRARGPRQPGGAPAVPVEHGERSSSPAATVIRVGVAPRRDGDDGPRSLDAAR
jgi:capsular polysaccharide biosynthesis protein